MSTTTQEQNLTVVRDCFEQAAAGNYDALPGLLSSDYVLHPEGIRGADGLAEMVEGYKAGFPDLTVTVDHQFCDGDYVASRCTFRGTHVSGAAVEFLGLTVSRCRDGRIEEEWELVDVAAIQALMPMT